MFVPDWVYQRDVHSMAIAPKNTQPAVFLAFVARRCRDVSEIEGLPKRPFFMFAFL